MLRPFLLAASIRLDEATAGAEVPEVKWIHVATEGEYRGHKSGPFALNADVFGTMVRNFKADARFKLGDDGHGSSPVVPYDYEHASEMAAFLGAIPESGTPAPAWARDLEVRQSSDGKAQLWALTKLGKKVRQQIADEEYQYVSIAFNPKAIDGVSGNDIGPKITSIAFTNQPFLTELTPIPIAAARMGLRGLSQFYGYPAGSTEKALEQTRELLGLPATADTAATMAEVEKVLGWASGAGIPPQGLEVDDLIAALRTTFGLPVTSTLEELGAEIRKAAGGLAEGDQSTPSKAAPGEAMGLSDLGKKLAAILTKSRVTLSVRLLQEDADVEKAVEELSAAGADLQSILGAMGVADPKAAIESVAQLRDAKTKLDSVQAELDAALQMQAKVEEAQGEMDVNAALTAKGMDKSASVALSAHRDMLIRDEVAKVPAAAPERGKQIAAARETGRKAFLTHYGVPEAKHGHLLQTLVAGPAGAQFTAPAAPPAARTLSIAGDATRGNEAGNGKVIDVSTHPGRNDTERAIAYLCSQNKELGRQDAFRELRQLRESGVVFTSNVQLTA